MSHTVYLVVSISIPRDHHAIFVETESDGNGIIFQVTGNIQNGMTYETKPGERPEESATFISKTTIGIVSAVNFPRIDTICRSVPSPPKQFDGVKRIYPDVPLKRCQEWTQEAIQALKEDGVLD